MAMAAPRGLVLAATLAAALGAAAPVSSQSGAGVAQMQMRIDALERELRRLTGEVEELEFRLRRQAEENAARFDDFEFRIIELEGGDPLAALRGDADEAAGAEAGETEEAVETAPAESALNVLREPAPDAAAAPPVNAPERADFDAAMRDLEALGLEAGARSVADFLERWPEGALGGSARLALAEAYVAEGRLREATRELVAGLRAHGDQPSGPETLVLLAETLHALDRVDDSCAAFVEFDIRYGDAPPSTAARARESARRLGCR